MFGIDWGSGNAALFEAIINGDELKVRQTLREKVDLVSFQANKSTLKKLPELEEGMCPLHVAAAHGRQSIAEMLLSLKANVRCRTSESGLTAVHLAARAGRKDLVELLADHGADIHEADASGRTPLHYAAESGEPSLVQFLISRRADAHAKDAEQQTPLHLAAKGGHKQAVMLLRAAGAGINDRDSRGRTPLHCAVLAAAQGTRGRYDPETEARREEAKATVKLLLNLGAEVNAVDQTGETPLDLLGFLEGDAVGTQLIDLLRANGGEWMRYRNRHPRANEPAPTMHDSRAAMTVPPPPPSSATVAGAHVPAEPVASYDGGNPILLGKGPLMFGRDLECDVRLESLTVSRRHARIERGQNGYVVEDLGSRNGTVINGNKIRQPQVLRAADILTLGEYDFRFDGARLVPIKPRSSASARGPERAGTQA